MHSLSTLVTKGSSSLGLFETEIGNCARVELQGVHFPPSIEWSTEELGGEAEDELGNEFRMHAATAT